MNDADRLQRARDELRILRDKLALERDELRLQLHLARAEPAASSTASRSSHQWSTMLPPSSGRASDRPQPRRSKRISRENPASRRRLRAAAGSSQKMSRWLQTPVVQTRSRGPLPVIW